jgi:cytochrome c-type biogenesis protein CcmH
MKPLNRIRSNRKISTTLAALVLTGALSGVSMAAIDVYQFDNPRQEAQYRALIEEFRCPKCQNQNLAGSDAPIAQDLKQKTYELVKDGRSDAEIRQYMYERYGDFISYKPPVRPSTWILWFFPPLLLALVLLGWFIKHRHSNQRKQLAEASVFDPLSDTEQQRLQQLLDAKNTEADKPN